MSLDLNAIEERALADKRYSLGATPKDVRQSADDRIALVARVRHLEAHFDNCHADKIVIWRKRAEAAEARCERHREIVETASFVICEDRVREELVTHSAGIELIRLIEVWREAAGKS